jgi:hypothetical protein
MGYGLVLTIAASSWLQAIPPPLGKPHDKPAGSTLHAAVTRYTSVGRLACAASPNLECPSPCCC